jgi:hypothetical protein
MMEWRPIETAPKDGAPVLLWLNPPLDTNCIVGYAIPGTLSVVVGWASDTWRGYTEWNCGFCEDGTADTEGYSCALMIAVYPTHWMPLPPPPVDQGQEHNSCGQQDRAKGG